MLKNPEYKRIVSELEAEIDHLSTEQIGELIGKTKTSADQQEVLRKVTVRGQERGDISKPLSDIIGNKVKNFNNLSLAERLAILQIANQEMMDDE